MAIHRLRAALHRYRGYLETGGPVPCSEVSKQKRRAKPPCNKALAIWVLDYMHQVCKKIKEILPTPLNTPLDVRLVKKPRLQSDRAKPISPLLGGIRLPSNVFDPGNYATD